MIFKEIFKINMTVSSLNLVRPIIHCGITRFHVLLFLLVHSSSVTAQLNNRPQDDRLYSNFDPTAAIVIVVLICGFFFIGVFGIFLRHCSENEARITSDTDRSRRNGGIEPEMIEKFPVFLYSDVKDVKIGQETLECAICLSEFEDDETLRLLPKCSHVFHSPCIDEWLTCHVTCPVCRANLTKITATLQQTTSSSNEVAIDVQPPRPGISGKFPRSHSTGHSLVQTGSEIDFESYTLKLPAELRNQIIACAKLKRAMSFNAILATEGSSKRGNRSSSGGDGSSSSRGKQLGRSERWRFLKMSPFVSRGGSVKSWKVDSEGDSVNGRNLLASVKNQMPLNCKNMKNEGVDEPSTCARPPI